MFELFLVYFFPAIAMIAVPNRLIWLIAAIALLLYLYRDILLHMADPQIVLMAGVVVVPALICKVIGIWLREKDKIMTGRLVPLLGLTGPLVAILFGTQIEHTLALTFPHLR